jgi:hypothetical protein
VLVSLCFEQPKELLRSLLFFFLKKKSWFFEAAEKRERRQSCITTTKSRANAPADRFSLFDVFSFIFATTTQGPRNEKNYGRRPPESGRPARWHAPQSEKAAKIDARLFFK